jgi:hypothetical protein
MSECLSLKGKTFTVAIDALDFEPTGAERKIKLWREMIRAGIKVPPIKVRPNPDTPGRWIVFSGEVAVEAARKEGYPSIECISI